MKDRERERECHRLAMNNEMLKVNVMRDTGLDFGKETRTLVEKLVK